METRDIEIYGIALEMAGTAGPPDGGIDGPRPIPGINGNGPIPINLANVL
jgi:hypothetical protein